MLYQLSVDTNKLETFHILLCFTTDMPLLYRFQQSSVPSWLFVLFAFCFATPSCAGRPLHYAFAQPFLSNNNNNKDATVNKSPVPPPPAISMPVWSLATPNRRTGTSMNVVTFCTKVSVASPQLWIVSLYHNTLTKDSFEESRTAVLQLLRPAHKHLVPVLGKRSGYDVTFSKRQACADVGFPWQTSTSDGAAVSTIECLPDCATYVRLQLLQCMEAGDHVVALCQEEGYGVWNSETQMIQPQGSASLPPLDHTSVLYTGLLRQEGIL
jgi:flavin reductase (DIM6/NTAB) family NADH-FMN oxidoreductase RutF